MSKRGVVVLTGCLTILLCRQVPASEPRDLIFAGNALNQLYAAVSNRRITIENQMLLRDLGGIPGQRPNPYLAALVVPSNAGTTNPVVRKVYDNENTFLEPQTVNLHDIQALRKVGQDGIVRFFLRRENSGPELSPKQADELLAIIEALPQQERVTARRFAGEILTDRGIAVPKLTGLVREFQEATTKELTNVLTAARVASQFEVGRPYSFGHRAVTERDLVAIPSQDVSEIRIGSEIFRRGWVGSTMVLVKPTPDDVSVPGAAGLEQLRVRPDIMSPLREGLLLPPRELSPVGAVIK